MKAITLTLFFYSIWVSTFSQVNLTMGLVAYYPFNGNTLDMSGNNNNATNFGATLTTDQWGNANSAYIFNGISNYMSVVTSPTLQMQSITLCARVKPNAFYGGPCFNNSIFDRGNGGYGSGSFSLVYTPTLNQNPGNYCTTPDSLHENYRINVNGSANASLWCITPINGIPYINTNQWDCVIGIYDSVSMVGSIYVNGVFRYSYTYLNGMGNMNNNTLFIGGTTNPTYPYFVNGVLDELRIYNRALNIQEIDSICNYNPNIPLDTIISNFSFAYPEICDSSQFQFTDLSYAINSNIISWYWDFGDGNISNMQNPSHNYANAGFYNVTLIVTNNFLHSDTSIVSVSAFNVAPVIIANASPVTVCFGNSTTLSGSGGNSYIWTGGIIDGVAFTPAVTTTFTVTGTDANGCTNTSSITVTVNQNPVITATANPALVCQGAQTTLNGNGGVFYLWTGGATNGVPFAILNTTTYTVTGTDANGCTNTSSITVNVNPAPLVVASANPAVICFGNQTTLSGSGALTYVWTGGAMNGIPVFPPTTTTYTVTGTDAGGCTASSTVLVTVNPLPAIVANANPAAVCAGNSTILNGGGGNSYTWNGGIADGIAFTPVLTNTYTVTGIDANGCSNTSSIIVVVHSIPLIGANANPALVCEGDSTTLNGNGGISYVWTGGATDGVPFNILNTTTFTVTGTDANGCSNTSNVTVNVNPAPLITGLANPGSVCIGNPTILTGNGGISYLWSGGVTNGIAFVPPGTTSYTLTGSDANGCTSTSSITVLVNPLPNIVANANPPSICPGTSAVLAGSGGTSYIWSGGIADGSSVFPVSTTTYSVTGTDANGCSNTSTVTVSVNPDIPVFITISEPIICLGDSTLLIANGALNYTWAIVPGLNAFAGDSVWANPPVSSTYTVTGADANGCTGTSTVLVNVVPFVDIVVTKNRDAECNINTVQLQVSGAQNYLWSPANLLSNPTGSLTDANIPEQTTFYVTGSTGTCADTDSIIVNYYNNDESSIIIPTAFSPNKDGVNDCFRILHRANFTQYYMAIYNRWGERVFESSDPDACWNGEHKNENAPLESYYYYLKGESICGKIFRKGDITLVR